MLRRLCTLAIVASLVSPALAQGEAGFYRGKSISVLIGFGPGGSNDVWARLLARHMLRHIPGEPKMVPQNMPGAGTLKLANYLATVAPRDGTVLGLISRGIPLEPLLGGQNVQFDPQKMTWIGSPDRDTNVCAARKDAKVRSMMDLRAAELVVGASGSGADTAIYPEFLAEFLGLKFRTIKGYAGTNEIVLAMERNEVQGVCAAYQSLKRTRPYIDGELNILFQAGLERDPGIPAHVPLLTEMAVGNKTDSDILRLFLARAALGRPFVAPPGIPADRIETLRKAFDATTQDPAFMEEAEKLQLTVEPISGGGIAKIIYQIYASPTDVVQRVARILGQLSGHAPK
jgi:tripartite-type tricarboxylate transporter receptor subunit TctC